MEYYPPQLLIIQLMHMKTITEEYTWLARTEGAMARTTIFLLYALHEDRCLSSQEGESRDLRVLILMPGTVL